MSIEHEQLLIALLNAIGADLAHVRQEMRTLDAKMQKSLDWQKRRDKRKEKKRKGKR
jgi:hypothetical protein